jgi:hypothetical protein
MNGSGFSDAGQEGFLNGATPLIKNLVVFKGEEGSDDEFLL